MWGCGSPETAMRQIKYMGGCQKYDPFWGTLTIRRRMIIGIQKGTISLTTTHIPYCSVEYLGMLGLARQAELWPRLEFSATPL